MPTKATRTTSACAHCGYTIWTDQTTEALGINNFNRHTTWQQCQQSIERGDGYEQDVKQTHARQAGRRYAGLHFQ